MCRIRCGFSYPPCVHLSRVSIFFYVLTLIIFKTNFGIALFVQYYLVFAALIFVSGPCMGTEGIAMSPDDLAGLDSSRPDPDKKTENPEHEAEKAGIND